MAQYLKENIMDIRGFDPAEITVHVPLHVLWDFESTVKVKREILDRLGCTACTSGFDLRFRGIREFVVNPSLEITEHVG